MWYTLIMDERHTACPDCGTDDPVYDFRTAEEVAVHCPDCHIQYFVTFGDMADLLFEQAAEHHYRKDS